MIRESTPLFSIRKVIRSADGRMAKAMRLAEAIQVAGDYRWVGIYDVDAREIAVIGWSGAGSPSFPRFAVTEGLNGAVVASRTTVVVNNVSEDPRYLTTSDSTQSEIVVPVLDVASGRVVGTIDVESYERDAFTDDDRDFLEECAAAMAPFWSSARAK